MKNAVNLLLGVICTLCFVSCKDEPKLVVAVSEKADTSTVVDPNQLVVKSEFQLTDEKGVIGLFHVPEMLTISKTDSAQLSKMASKLAKAYGVLQKDIKAINAQVNGSAGSIYYNSDTSNFVFECVIPLSEMPKIQPKNSQIVVLEQSKMLIYNYYGAYKDLSQAYQELNIYKMAYNLIQIGPMREFYITDPLKEKDTSKWLTRIMVPVK